LPSPPGVGFWNQNASEVVKQKYYISLIPFAWQWQHKSFRQFPGRPSTCPSLLEPLDEGDSAEDRTGCTLRAENSFSRGVEDVATRVPVSGTIYNVSLGVFDVKPLFPGGSFGHTDRKPRSNLRLWGGG